MGSWPRKTTVSLYQKQWSVLTLKESMLRHHLPLGSCCETPTSGPTPSKATPNMYIYIYQLSHKQADLMSLSHASKLSEVATPAREGRQGRRAPSYSRSCVAKSSRTTPRRLMETPLDVGNEDDGPHVASPIMRRLLHYLTKPRGRRPSDAQIRTSRRPRKHSKTPTGHVKTWEDSVKKNRDFYNHRHSYRRSSR
jgi:hypothetical protein